MDSPTLLVIGHDVAPATVLVQAGTITDWARARGITPRPVVSGGDLGDPRDVDAVAVLGSPEGAWDDTVPWLAGEIDFLERAVAADVPVLGVCFGGQLLARVLGGTVRAAPDPGSELGFRTVESVDDDVPPGPWMEFHFDTFTTPPGALRLATTEHADQAFRLGPHLGTQFHPEVTPASFDTWTARWAGTRLEREVLPARGLSTAGLRAQVDARADASRAASGVLFDGFAARAGLSGRMLSV